MKRSNSSSKKEDIINRDGASGQQAAQHKAICDKVFSVTISDLISASSQPKALEKTRHEVLPPSVPLFFGIPFYQSRTRAAKIAV